MEKSNENNVNMDNLLHKNASRANTMNESICSIVRTYHTNRNGLIEIPTDLNTLFTFVASKNGATVLLHLSKYQATFALELFHLYKIKRPGVYALLSSLERIGLIEESGAISRGTGGRTSKVYSLVGADSDALTKAQSRYRDIKNVGTLVKNNLDQYREQAQIQQDYTEQLERENQEAKRENIIGMLVTGYNTIYEDTGKPICLKAIEKALRNNQLDTKHVHSIAETLEKTGTLITYTNRNGEPDPTWTPSPTILAIRAKRSSQNE